MPRPKGRRLVKFSPKANYFKPQGIPLRGLEVIELSHEEMEALKLYENEGLSQIECAKKMKTSQSTIQRILDITHRKIAKALIEGKAIKIINN